MLFGNFGKYGFGLSKYNSLKDSCDFKEVGNGFGHNPFHVCNWKGNVVDSSSKICGYTQPAHGKIDLLSNGKFTYKPHSGFLGIDSFCFFGKNSYGNYITEKVELLVNKCVGTNNAPDARNDSYQVTQGSDSTTLSVLSNDSDKDGDKLSIKHFEQPSNGTVTLNADGTFSYTPDCDFTGKDVFKYTISDGKGGKYTAQVVIQVINENEAPVAGDDAAETTEGSAVTISVLENDTDNDGDKLEVSSFEQPANGSVTLNANGTFTYTPDDEFTGADSFEYTIADGKGGTDTAVVWINVGKDNEAPIAEDDHASGEANSSFLLSPLDNDHDPDGDTLTVIDAIAQNGTVVIRANGTLKYTPDTDYTGDDTITYTISDGNGGEDTASISINISDSNQLPEFTNLPNNKLITINENETFVKDLDAKDLDGDDLTFSIVGGADKNKFNIDPETGELTFKNAPDYENPSDKNGDNIYKVKVEISDGKDSVSKVIRVKVKNVNENSKPEAEKDTASTDEGQAVIIDALKNDSDADNDTLTIKKFDQAKNGTVTLNDDNTFTYEPNPGFTGTDSFTYKVSDGNGGTDTSKVTITVNSTNTAPEFTNLPNNGIFHIFENETFVEQIAASDVDGDDLTYSISGGADANKFEIDPVTGALTFKNAPDYENPTDKGGNNIYNVKVSVSDGQETVSTTIKVKVKDINENTAPNAVNDRALTEQGEAVTIAALKNDSDPENDTLSIVDFKQPANGTVVLNDDGTFTYQPDPSFSGNDSFTYEISDGNGGKDTAKVTVTVNSANSAPEFTNLPNNGIFHIFENETFVEQITASDVDGDDLTYSISGGADASKFEIDPVTGALTFKNAPDYENPTDKGGNNIYNVKVSVSDGQETVTTTVKVKVKDINENTAPDAVDDFALTEQGEAVTIAALKNDSDPENDSLTIVDFEQPANGTVVLNNNGTFTYQPKPGFSGNDSFTYEISDDNGGKDTATAFITIEENKPAVCANLVGDRFIDEGASGSYKIVLDAPLDHDAWFELQVNDGSAHRVDHAAANQDIMWGGYYDTRYGIGGKVAQIFHNKIPNGPTTAYGNRDATGPSDASWDFSLYQDNCLIQGNRLYVKIPAGETSSNTLDIAAWKEKVTVDNDAGNSAGHLEGSETFEVEIVGSKTQGDVEICNDELQVHIQDKTDYYKVSPIAIDLNRDGVIGVTGETSSKDKNDDAEIGRTVQFDIDGDGDKDTIEWFDGSGDGILVDNLDGNAANDMDGSRLFGDEGGKYSNGYEKLAKFDSNSDGKIAGDELKGLEVWRDDGDAIVESGEIVSLFDAGITSLSTQMKEVTDDQGKMLMQSTATTTDGEQLITEDVWFESANYHLVTEEDQMDQLLEALPEDETSDAAGKTAISADSGSREISYDSGSRDSMDQMKKLYDDQADIDAS